MILYSLLRAIAGIALRWYYREIEVRGLEQLPADTPIILVANHPNALIDALAIGWAVPRPVRLTAKGTLFEHPLIGPLFRSLGIVPLHRATDPPPRAGADAGVPISSATQIQRDFSSGKPQEKRGSSIHTSQAERDSTGNATVVDKTAGDRNAKAFRAILDALRQRRIVLIFPEGTTHNRPELAPLKSGAARLALAARSDRDTADVQLIAVGLFFENKSRPRSRVLVQFGAPLSMDQWAGATVESSSAVQSLTSAIDRQLRLVTLNFPTAGDAADVRRVARLLSDALGPPRPVAAPQQPLGDEFVLIRRVDAARRIMASAQGVESIATHTALAGRASALLLRIEAFERESTLAGLEINDIDISLSTMLGARFALREGGIAIATAPLSWWGRLNHWLPFRVAGAMGRRPRLNSEDPAMHTIAWGVVLVLLAYAVQTTLVAWWLGGWWGLVYLVSLPPSASWDLRYRDRISRAIGRMHAYLRFRRNPALQQRLADELQALRIEAAAIDRMLNAGVQDRPQEDAELPQGASRVRGR